MRTFQFKVPKMKCNGCVNAIRNGLLQIDGIQGIEANLGEQTIVISCSDDPSLEAAISSKLKDIGYEGIILN